MPSGPRRRRQRPERTEPRSAGKVIEHRGKLARPPKNGIAAGESYQDEKRRTLLRFSQACTARRQAAQAGHDHHWGRGRVGRLAAEHARYLGDCADSVKFVPALLMMPNRVVEERVKRLPQSLRQPLTDEARQEVVGAAGRKARDQPHRPRRICLRQGEARRGRERSRARGQAQKPTA